ncbi:TetR/AcrR family transcriptional regulator [Wukongibacter baidiensis]|uniref:TetR/AcrR family transcriptional regulator n=1 Tax=Wukongibacter baidiensis TaxID=1723361 RepID=UPI003D7F2406
MSISKEKNFKGKQELIEVALEQFSNRGYVKASINDILRDAGMSKGTFYYHFENKEDLYLYLIGILIEKKKNHFTREIKAEDYKNNDFFSLLRLLTKSGMEFARENQSFYKFSERFIRERGTDIYETALKKYNFQDNEYFEYLVGDAIKRGEFREDLPEEFIKNIINYLFTHTVEILNNMEMDQYEEGYDYFFKFLEGGLKRK